MRWGGSFKKLSSEESDSVNVSIVNQWNKFYDGSRKLEKTKYFKNLSMLAFLAAEPIKPVDDMIKSGNMKASWEDINKNMTTNSGIQNIKVLESTYYLCHERADKIYEISRRFIKKFKKCKSDKLRNYSIPEPFLF